MIVALRVRGAPAVLELPAERRTFTIGAGDADRIVPRELAAGVAPTHALIERDDAAIVIRDHGAGHGLYRSPRSGRVAALHLHAGSTGWLGGCQVLALDHALAALRPSIARGVGLDCHETIDAAIEHVAEGGPLAIVGPRNLDALALAHAIHLATAGRDRSWAVCEGAALGALEGLDGTLAIDLDRVTRLPAARVADVFSARCAVRAIFLATRARTLRTRLDLFAPRVRTIELAPLHRRPDDVPRLLQAVWRDELGSDRSVDALGARSLRGLAAYRWPANLAELRAHAPRLLAYAEHPSLRRAAVALGVRHQTLSQHLQRVGVVILDQQDRELPLARSGRATP